MQPLQVGDGGLGRVAAVEVEVGVVERVEHRRQPLGPFGMAGAGAVRQHVGWVKRATVIWRRALEAGERACRVPIRSVSAAA